MASLRDIRTRIAATKSTRQITSAMKMVSAAKLRRATEAATSARPYQQRLTATLQRVAQGAGDSENPLLKARPEVKKVILIVLGSDRGLCAGFNNTLNRRVLDWLDVQKEQHRTVAVRTYGKKPRDFMKARGVAVAEARIEVTNVKYAGEATALANELTALFVAGEVDEVWIGFNQFKNTLVQIPTFSKVLPLSIDASAGAVEAGPDYRYEPAGPQILDALLPLYLRTLLLGSFLETEAGEQASRMTAMDNATRNASDLINSLTLLYNRGRQAAITKELIEIVSGAEAL